APRVLTDRDTDDLCAFSLHDALPISQYGHRERGRTTERSAGQRAIQTLRNEPRQAPIQNAPKATRNRSISRATGRGKSPPPRRRDRKSTRLNSSHDQISYAVFCLKKK